MERVLRTRLFAAVVLVLVFGAGVLLGLALDQGRHELGNEGDRDRAAEARRTPTYMQVHPTEQQKVLIDSIVGEHRAAMRALHEEFRAKYDPRYQALIKETREAIKGVLTPEQATQYDSIVAANDRKRAERAPRQDRE